MTPDNESPSPVVQGLVWSLFFLFLFSIYWALLLWRGLLPQDDQIFHFAYPNWVLFQNFFSRPSSAFWNVFANMGQPHAADPRSMVFYPPAWILGVVPSFRHFLIAWIMFHSTFAAIFTAKLAHEWTNDPWCSAMAVVGWVFGGFFYARAGAPTDMAAASFLPALLLAQRRGVTFGVSGALALQWFAGSPPLSFLSLLVLFVTGALNGRSGLVWTLRAMTLGVLLSAVQWILLIDLLGKIVWPPILEWTSLSFRSHAPWGIVAAIVAIIGSVQGGRNVRWLLAGALVFLGFAFWPTAWLMTSSAAFLVGGFFGSLVAAHGLRFLPENVRPWLVLAAAAELTLYAWTPKPRWVSDTVFTDPEFIQQARALGPAVRWYDASSYPNPMQLSLRAYGLREVQSGGLFLLRRASTFQQRLSPTQTTLLALAGARGLFQTTHFEPVAHTLPPVSMIGARPKDWTNLKSYDPGHLEVRTITFGARDLVFNEILYPGWHAAIDGASVPIQLVEDTFMKVSIPQGSHVVTFDYHPRGLRVGAWLSLITLLLLSAGSWAPARTKRSPE